MYHDKLGRIWKEKVLDYLRLLSAIFFELLMAVGNIYAFLLNLAIHGTRVHKCYEYPRLLIVTDLCHAVMQYPYSV
jgi:hypothetical protein